MSRHGWAVLQVTLILAALSVGLALAPAAVGQEKKAAKLSVHEKLALEIETKNFINPLPFKHFLEILHDMCHEKGADLPILVDINAFKDENPDGVNGPNEDEIRLPPTPRTMTVAQALQLGISQIKTGNGTFIVQNGWIVILTRGASLEGRLQERVVAHFEKTPFTEVVKRLADMTGATILIDPRVHEKAQAPVTADLTGNVALAALLPAIADMADLRVVRIAVDTVDRGPRKLEAAAMAETLTVAARSFAQAAIQDMPDPRVVEECLYVTSPTNADALEKRLRQRKEEDRKEKERKPIGGGGGILGMGGLMGNPGGQGKTVSPELRSCRRRSPPCAPRSPGCAN